MEKGIKLFLNGPAKEKTSLLRGLLPKGGNRKHGCPVARNKKISVAQLVPSLSRPYAENA